MKRPGVMTLAASFLGGLVIGGTVVVLFLYSTGMIYIQPSAFTANKISETEARSLIGNYRGSNQDGCLFKAIKIDKEQLGAMHEMLSDPLVISYRIYFGLARTIDTCCVVVGVDQRGRYLPGTPIFKTKKGTFDPCPPICDSSLN